MARPQIICHMVTSLDGRLMPDRWPGAFETLMQTYDQTAARLDADGWIVGRTTMAYDVPSGDPSLGPATPGRSSRIADRAGRALAVGFDREGHLRPESSDVEGDHLVLVLSDRVSDAHVDWLAARGVSVVFSGPDGDDLAGALERIGAAFGPRRLLLEGGGRINGSFLAAGLIDETSTLIHPVVDGQADVPAIYDRPMPTAPWALELLSCEALADGTVWLRHRLRRD